MPFRRGRVVRARHAITPEAVEAFADGDWIRLHRALGLKPWECSPLDARDDFVLGSGTAFATSVEQARQLRAELLRVSPRVGANVSPASRKVA